MPIRLSPFIIFILLCRFASYAQESSEDSTTGAWFEQRMSMLLAQDSSSEVLVEIASKKGQSLREAPSIVSAITREEIAKYGARDLSDVLRMVPGFDFAVDVNGLLSLGVRGAWAHEGKALLMINGVGINELAFGNLNFFGSYPAAMIERVEIIRGPGSVLYGGFAEVAVINIITTKIGDAGGLIVNLDGGVLGDREYSGNIGINYGLKVESTEISIAAGIGSNPQSTREYQAFGGNIPSTILNNENAYRKFHYFIATCKSKGLTAKYSHTSFDFSAQQSGGIRPQINGIYGEKRNNTVDAIHLDYQIKLGEDTYLQPIGEYTFSNVISTTVNPALSVQGTWRSPAILMEKGRAELALSHNDRLLIGGGYTQDHIDALSDTGRPGLKLSNAPADTAQYQSIHSVYGYFQYTTEWKNWDFTIGGRYETTSFGDALLPRASAVYVKDKLHMKALFGRSFRIPMPFQAYTRAWGDGDRTILVPELATTIELELGYRLNKQWTVTGNLFYLDIQKPIVFIVESYRNFGQLQSAGVEAEIRGNLEKLSFFTNLAYYVPLGSTSPDFLSGDEQQFLGFAPLKINTGASFQFGEWSIAPSATFFSARAGATEAFAKGQTNGNFESTLYNALLLGQLQLTKQNLLSNLDCSLTLYNVFNTDYQLIQPYYDNHAPIPVNDRHLVFGISWKL